MIKKIGGYFEKLYRFVAIALLYKKARAVVQWLQLYDNDQKVGTPGLIPGLYQNKLQQFCYLSGLDSA